MSHEIPVSAMEQQARDLVETRRRNPEANLPGLDLDPQVVRCDPDTMTLELAFDTKHWMKNPIGVVHGGVIAILLDNTMGTAIASLCGLPTPTITMTINYARPVPLDTTIIIRTRVVMRGRTSSQLSAEIFLPDQPDRILVTATGVYSTKKA